MRAASLLLVLLVVPFAAAHGQTREEAAPAWASSEGWDFFTKGECARCHGLRGVGGRVARDLAALPPGTGYFDLAAAVWNHVSRLGVAMWESGVERQLTPYAVSGLLSFIASAQYLDASGDPVAGARLFAVRGCAGCHAVGGNGGGDGPALDAFAQSNASALLAAAAWNHPVGRAGQSRAAAVQRIGEGELRHMVAHIVRAARATDGAATQVVAATPREGERVFTERGCASCHTGGLRPGAGGRPETLSELARRLWNHERTPAARMSAHDLAALVAYLHASRYFDGERGDVGRGRTLLRSKGCLGCHAVYGKNGKIAPDLATSNVVGSPDGHVAAMWNHSRSMKTTATRQAVALPRLSGRELADITTYLGGLGRAPRQSR